MEVPSWGPSLVEVLGKSPHWAKRQTYAVLCGEMTRKGEDTGGFSPANYSSELLPHLLDLAWDKVGLLSENNYSVKTRKKPVGHQSRGRELQADIYYILRFYSLVERLIKQASQILMDQSNN